MNDALEQLPTHMHRDDLEQISINTLVERWDDPGAVYVLPPPSVLYRARYQVSGDGVQVLSSQGAHTVGASRSLRELELDYLEQEVMLRQSERLATLGRLSAGMAHELNNPAAVARQGAEQLRTSIARLEQAQFALGEAGLIGANSTTLSESWKRRLRNEPGSRACSTPLPAAIWSKK